MDDFRSVLAAARMGEEAAWERIYRSLAGSVIGYLRARGAADPEDLAGEAFLQIVRDLDRFAGDERDFRAWAFTIVHRRLIDDRRRRARRPAVADGPVPEVAAGDVRADASARLERAAVLDVLAGLPVDQRTVLLLRILGDMTIEEIASAVGKRPGAVKALQRRGLRRAARAYPVPLEAPEPMTST
jgi:RNA polymerase sigma-70 factor (ECF subfamily)